MSSTSRIALSRILAVNWYGYRQFIDVSGLTLITGANGSGKSALLDLIQFVMLGEQQSRFNKAAAGAGSGRTLRGYCLCDTNTTGRDGAERYLRPSGVTVAALEFTWPLAPGQTEPRREAWGARIQYENPTSKPATVWFRTGRRLEWSDFMREEAGPQAMQFTTEDEFRTRVRRDLDGDAWDRQQTYLSEMALRSHLGFDEKQMAKTLPRAMAFEPESNFEKFVRDFLLEPGMPDVRAVKASVDAHRRAHELLNKMHDQLERLMRIAVHHKTWSDARRESALFHHLRDALAHEETLEVLNQKRAKLDGERAKHADNEEASAQAISERDELRRQLNEVQLIAGSDGQVAELSKNRARRRDLEKELNELREAAKSARQFLTDRARKWDDWLKHAATLGLAIPEDAAKELKLMRGHEEARGLDAAARMTRVFQQFRVDAEGALRPIEERIEELESRITSLRRDLDNLREGHAAPSPLLNALKSRGQRAVALGRMVEVKPEAEAWWPLIETLLGASRQAILAEDFRAAWEVAQKSPSTAEPLVNVDELASKKSVVKKGSVRGFLETKHSAASTWLDAMLGDLIAVKKTSQLEQHERALSLDGWLKDPPLRVKLTPEKELTLGEEGLRRLRELREDALRNVEAELTTLKRQRDDWRAFLNRGREWKLHDSDAPPGTDTLALLPHKKNEADQLDTDYEFLATPDRLQTLEKLRTLEATLDGVKERIIRLDERMAGFKQLERELTDSIASYVEDEQSAAITRQSSRALLAGVLDAEITERITASKGDSWRKRIEQAAELARQFASRADESRRLRDEQRRDLILPQNHPELADALDTQEEGNDSYDARRKDLETHELERFKAAAEEAKRDWEDRLQHQVLDVLREKISEADRTKRELNRAMDHEIGGWRYQLTSRADRAHTAIWTLVEKGLPSGAEMELFNAAGRDDIERAKAELMVAIDAADNPEDKRHQRALDYRYYHHWDIEAKPAGRGDAAAISLNKSAKKQSGGENQAPFFVATLAAFRRVYDLGRREAPQNLGLVVMDEAFSKLSGDRIDNCLELARNFGLQLIMAFPEDRLPTMFQHADTVVQCRVERGYDEANEQMTTIENWVVRVEAARLMEIME